MTELPESSPDDHMALVQFLEWTRSVLDKLIDEGMSPTSTELFYQELRDPMISAWKDVRPQFEELISEVLDLEVDTLIRHGLYGSQLRFKLATTRTSTRERKFVTSLVCVILPALCPRSLPSKPMLTEPEKTFLSRLAARAKTEQRLALRAKILLALDQGHSVSETARDLKIVRNTVKKWRDRWCAAQSQISQAPDEATLERLALAVLSDAARSGKPADFTAEQITQILALACEPPEESGRAITHWTHRELADEAIKRGIIVQISPRSAGRFLKRGRSQAASLALLAQ